MTINRRRISYDDYGDYKAPPKKDWLLYIPSIPSWWKFLSLRLIVNKINYEYDEEDKENLKKNLPLQIFFFLVVEIPESTFDNK